MAQDDCRPTVRPVLAIGDRPVLVQKLLFYKPNLLAHCALTKGYDLFPERQHHKQQINYSIVTKNKPRLYNKDITSRYWPMICSPQLGLNLVLNLLKAYLIFEPT